MIKLTNQGRFRRYNYAMIGTIGGPIIVIHLEGTIKNVA